MKIKVSIIVPAYNVENYIIRCLNSIEFREDVEIIIIDDKSPDCTLDKIKDWISTKETSKITLLCNEINKGEGATINRGIDIVKGEYFGILDSDDYYLLPLSKIIPYFDGTDLVYYDLEINSGYVLELNNSTKGHYCGATKFYKKEFVGNTRRNEKKRIYGDVEFYKELLDKKPTEKFTNLKMYHYNFPRKGSLMDEENKKRKQAKTNN